MAKPIMSKAMWPLMAALVFGAASCHQDANPGQASRADGFYIEGTVAGLDSGAVVLIHQQPDGRYRADTTPLSGHRFRFSGNQPDPRPYWLSLPGHSGTLFFFVENDSIRIAATVDSLDRAVVTGSAAQQVYDAYRMRLAPVADALEGWTQSYSRAYAQGDWSMRPVLDRSYDSLQQVRYTEVSRFVKDYPTSVVAAWAVTRHFLYAPDAAQLDTLYRSLEPPARQSVYGQRIKMARDAARQVAPGTQAPAFTQADTAGRALQLSSLQGNYVLINFWASWCGTCREAHSRVRQAYRQYKDKGFTVVGVSLDEEKASWMQAIHQDHLGWYQLSDLRGWRNAVAEQYGVQSLPANVLIDRNGIILDRNLTGDRLADTLAEIFREGT
jgi:peroxiredoxin